MEILSGELGARCSHLSMAWKCSGFLVTGCSICPGVQVQGPTAAGLPIPTGRRAHTQHSCALSWHAMFLPKAALD